MDEQRKEKAKKYRLEYYRKNRERILSEPSRKRQRAKYKATKTLEQRQRDNESSKRSRERAKVAGKEYPFKDYFKDRKQYMKSYCKEWAKSHPDYFNTYNRKYRKDPNNKAKLDQYFRLYMARREEAQPHWLSDDQICEMAAMYYERDRLNEEQGSTKICPDHWTVDHIIPLKGKSVCGLHVPWNLQLMRHKNNSSKGNTVGEA
jgi:hypothetical protein